MKGVVEWRKEKELIDLNTACLPAHRRQWEAGKKK
jgi:hypothetical protein